MEAPSNRATERPYIKATGRYRHASPLFHGAVDMFFNGGFGPQT